MSWRALALAAVVGLGGCRAAPAPAATPMPAGYHGVVLWISGARVDTLTVAFDAPWSRVAAGVDTVWAFARQPAGSGWSAHGRMVGDSMVWGLSRMAGDAGSVREMAGVVESGGAVRGCARVRGGAGGAFALRPRGGPAPAAGDAPLAACRRTPSN